MLPRGLPARRPVGAQGVRHLRDELGHRRARHVAARRDGVRQDRSSRPTPAAFPEVVADGATGLPRAAARSRRPWPDAIVQLLKDDDLRRRMGPAGLRAGARLSAPSGWCRTRCRSTSGGAAAACGRLIRSSEAGRGTRSWTLRGTATRPDLQPDARADSRRTSRRAPFSENVTPRAMREVRRAVGIDQVDLVDRACAGRASKMRSWYPLTTNADAGTVLRVQAISSQCSDPAGARPPAPRRARSSVPDQNAWHRSARAAAPRRRTRRAVAFAGLAATESPAWPRRACRATIAATMRGERRPPISERRDQRRRRAGERAGGTVP